MKNYPIEKYKFYFYNEKKNDGTETPVVCAVSTYCGKTVKGYAKCDPRDEYDVEKGKQLAAARCNAKVAAKRQARATMKLKQAQKQLDEARLFYIRMSNYYEDSRVDTMRAERTVASLNVD